MSCALVRFAHSEPAELMGTVHAQQRCSEWVWAEEEEELHSLSCSPALLGATKNQMMKTLVYIYKYLFNQYYDGKMIQIGVCFKLKKVFCVENSEDTFLFCLT